VGKSGVTQETTGNSAGMENPNALQCEYPLLTEAGYFNLQIGVTHMIIRKKISLFDQRSVLLGAAITLATASAAFAQGTAPAMGADQEIAASFQKADKNGDKFLSMDEVKAMPELAAQFKAIDTNGDGRISLEEYAAAMKK
jgi:hypothetical protein